MLLEVGGQPSLVCVWGVALGCIAAPSAGFHPPTPQTSPLGLVKAEGASSSWGTSAQVRSQKVNPAAHQDFGVSPQFLLLWTECSVPSRWLPGGGGKLGDMEVPSSCRGPRAPSLFPLSLEMQKLGSCSCMV